MPEPVRNLREGRNVGREALGVDLPVRTLQTTIVDQGIDGLAQWYVAAVVRGDVNNAPHASLCRRRALHGQ